MTDQSQVPHAPDGDGSSLHPGAATETTNDGGEPLVKDGRPAVRGDERRLADDERLSSRSVGDRLTYALIALCGIFLALVSFLGGMLVEREYNPRDISDSPVDGERIEEVARIVEGEYYYLPEDPQAREQLAQEMEEGALEGMVAGLGDPYTAYLPPEDAGPLNDQLEGEYEGIGVSIQVIDGQLVVLRPLPGSPAERVGIKAGDIIVAADGVPLGGLTLAEAGEYVRGPAGTTVTLEVFRPELEQTLTFTVTRERLEEQVVIYRFDQATGIAYIRVTIFSDKTTSQLDAALRQARADGATGMVLDLRGNGGGWVVAAQEMIGRFVNPAMGYALYEDSGHDGDGGELVGQPILAGDVTVYDLPLVVLVDGGTASAAEIVAGALRDYGRAVLIGETTFGKGSVQRIHEFEDGASLRVTIAEWLTPNRTFLTGQGLAPDVVVPVGTAPVTRDIQLDAAVQYLLTAGWSGLDLGW